MKKRVFISIAFWSLLFLPAVFVFAKLFIGMTLFGGDAPYFYREAFSDLLSPSTFTERGVAFGGVNQLFWLSPLMFLYGTLGKFLNFNNDLILKILFFFPSIILSAIGPYFLAKYLKFSPVVRFFSSLIYLFNTYYLLLLDGGQVGVALAYGIFPFAVLVLKKLADEFSKYRFLAAASVSFLLCLIDPRVFLIAFSVVFLWSLTQKRFPVRLLALFLIVLVFNFYWLIPLLAAGSIGAPSGVSEGRLLTLINPLLLFSPHWPNNIFGQTAKPPFYFLLVPILIFGSFVFSKKNSNIAILFLIFSAFSVIPLTWIFRDPTKFFMPVLLFSGILIGLTAEKLPKARPLIYLYVLFLIYPVINGQMNFLLSNHKAEPSYEIIHQELIKEENEFRTLWFPVKHPLTFETAQKPAIDGRDLANFRPFASMNASEDVFNFLNNPKFVDWLKVLNIKYLFLNGDARNIYPTETDKKNWETIKTLIAKASGLEKKDWKTNFEAYEVNGVFPRTFSVDKLVAVVGKDLSLTTPAIYFEDGKWDPTFLADKDPESVKVLFNGKNKLDLTMSFLQRYFLSPQESIKNEWAYYSAGKYLKYKYELLIRGFEFTDFDYGGGISFSTNKGELVKFKFKVPSDGTYIIAQRVADKENQNLSWQSKEIELKKGAFEYQVLNDSELKVLNVVALVPKEELVRAQGLAEEIVNRFGEVNKTDLKDLVQTQSGFWQITTDNFNPAWGSAPVFSMVNGFYTHGGKDIEIEPKGQENLKKGIYVSAFSILAITLGFLFFFYYKKLR